MTESSGGQNRLFLIVVVGLVGLLMIGMVSIAGLVVYTRFLAPSATPTVVAVITPSVAPTVAPSATRPPGEAATSTPEGGVPTPTRVIQEGTPGPEGPTPTATSVPVGGEDMPPTGFGPMEAVIGGLALILIILVVRRVRLRPGT